MPGLFETMRNEMRLRNYSPKTIKAYVSSIRALAHYAAPRHPRDLTNQDLRDFLAGLMREQDFAAPTINQIICAMNFLYCELYHRTSDLGELPRPKRECALPEILNKEEVLSISRAVENLKPRTIPILQVDWIEWYTRSRITRNVAGKRLKHA